MVDKKFKDFDAAASESAAEIIEFKIAGKKTSYYDIGITQALKSIKKLQFGI